MADKGKGILIEPPSDFNLLFKNSKTREDDNLTILNLILHFLHNFPGVPPSPESDNFHKFVRRISHLEPVKAKRLRNQMFQLRKNYRRLVDKKGGIKTDRVEEEKISGNFSQKVFELSEIIWSKKRGSYRNLFYLFRKSESGKEDYLTTLKFIHLYLCSNLGGGFDRVKDLDRLHHFIVEKSGELVSKPKLIERLWSLDEYYLNFIKPGNGNLNDPKEIEVLNLIRLIWESHNTNKNNERLYNNFPYEKRKNTFEFTRFRYTVYLFELYTKKMCFEEPRHRLFKYSMTAREDDLFMLQYLMGYFLCTNVFIWDSNEFHRLFNEVINEQVSPDSLSVKMLELEINYWMLHVEHGDEVPLSELLVGIFDHQGYDLSRKIWGKNGLLEKKNGSFEKDGTPKFGTVAYWIINYHDFILFAMRDYGWVKPREIVGAMGFIEESELEKFNGQCEDLKKDRDRGRVILKKAELVNIQEEILEFGLWDWSWQYELKMEVKLK